MTEERSTVAPTVATDGAVDTSVQVNRGRSAFKGTFQHGKLFKKIMVKTCGVLEYRLCDAVIPVSGIA